MTKYLPGTRIVVKSRDETVPPEFATVIRTTRDMLPLPAGYVPVRFDTGNGKLLVHESNISAYRGKYHWTTTKD